MGRREELEEEIRSTEQRIDNLPADAPQEVRDALRAELDSESFELDNLYDDPETETE